jgi:hypothetical protein
MILIPWSRHKDRCHRSGGHQSKAIKAPADRLGIVTASRPRELVLRMGLSRHATHLAAADRLLAFHPTISHLPISSVSFAFSFIAR